MDKSNFSKEELLEMEALEIRGGTSDVVYPQEGCSNKSVGCGLSEVPQPGCTNDVVGCTKSATDLLNGGC